jgi:hypothetical protein
VQLGQGAGLIALQETGHWFEAELEPTENTFRPHYKDTLISEYHFTNAQ